MYKHFVPANIIVIIIKVHFFLDYSVFFLFLYPFKHFFVYKL